MLAFVAFIHGMSLGIGDFLAMEMAKRAKGPWLRHLWFTIYTCRIAANGKVKWLTVIGKTSSHSNGWTWENKQCPHENPQMFNKKIILNKPTISVQRWWSKNKPRGLYMFIQPIRIDLRWLTLHNLTQFMGMTLLPFMQCKAVINHPQYGSCILALLTFKHSHRTLPSMVDLAMKNSDYP